MFCLSLTIYHMTWNKHLIWKRHNESYCNLLFKARLICCCFYFRYRSHLRAHLLFSLSQRITVHTFFVNVYLYFRTLKNRSSIIGPHWHSWLSPGVETTSGSGPWSCSFTILQTFFWRLIWPILFYLITFFSLFFFLRLLSLYLFISVLPLEWGF